jgi:hypothetical protein
MKIDIVNFARHAKPRELRWMAGTQFPQWIQEMLKRKAQGEDCGKLIEELAEVCNVTETSELLT